MKTGILKNVLVAMTVFCILAVVPSGCGSSSSSGTGHPNPTPYLQANANMETSIGRVEKTLALNPANGTVFIDKTSSNYASLTPTDKTYGRAMTSTVNEMVNEGLVSVNQDFSINWLGTPPASVQGANCSKHWWGEECNVDASTTKNVCIGLEAGDGAAIICGAIPIVDIACEIVEAVAIIPLEAEVCSCSDSGDGSIFHVAWIGVPWFKCQ